MEAHPWLKPDRLQEWVRAAMAVYVGFQIGCVELIAGMPQPRDWVFVGKTNNGPRGVFHFEIVCVWRN